MVCLAVWKHFDDRGKSRVCIIWGQVRDIWRENYKDYFGIDDESDKRYRMKVQGDMLWWKHIKLQIYWIRIDLSFILMKCLPHLNLIT